MTMTFNMPPHWLERKIRIVVIGAGGTGSDFLVRLAKLHTQLIALGGSGLDVEVHDGDIVTEFNCGRQHFPPCSVSLNKAIVLVNSINLAYQLNWRAVPDFYDVDDTSIHSAPDLFVTCVDNAEFRVQLLDAYDGVVTDTLILDGGNGRSEGQVVLGHIGKPKSGMRLPHVLDLWPEMREAPEDDGVPSCSAAESLTKQDWPVNQFVATLMVELLWTLIRYGCINYHGSTFNLSPPRVNPMMIDPSVWSFMGYNPQP